MLSMSVHFETREMVLEDLRETEALFRYSVIREALEEGIGPKERGARLRRLAAERHVHPETGTRQVSRSTLGRWVRAWRKAGFEGLKPALREVEPRTDPEILQQAFALRRQEPRRTGAQIAETLARYHGAQAPAERTVQRHLARAGLRQADLARSERVFGRFEADKPNDLWVADCLHGPAVFATNGQTKRKAILFAILDDHSRLCVNARFEAAETELRLERTLRGAIESRGVPQALYVDNGAPFISRQLERACAKLGIRLIHSRPGRPEGRGKIERFFRTLRSQFLVEAEQRPGLSLEELNRLLWPWLTRAYHQREHSETGAEPGYRYRSVEPRYAQPAEIREAFAWSEVRLVSKTATVSLFGNRYEVDSVLCGRQVEVVFDPHDLEVIEVRYAGKSFGQASPHEMRRHAHPRAVSDRALEAPEPLPGAIDYLALLKAEHERSLTERSGAIDYRQINHDPDTDTNPEERA